jgi:hypothetical protein
MALSLLALLAAIWAGLLRIGWAWPALRPLLPAVHGPLMVSGFLGTLIGLERAVAVQKRWAYLGPLLSGLGGLLLITDVPQVVGQSLLALGSLGMVVVFGVILRQHLAWHTATMAFGSLMWLVGNALWLFGWPIYQVVLWWMAFLVLTIAGERLELSRVLRPTQRTMVLFVGSAAVLVCGVLLGMFIYAPGVRLTGVGLLLLAAWFLRYDLAPRNLRQSGLVRYIAICLVSGYVWLLVGGLLAILFGGLTAGPRYDAILHAVFLGFVFSMIFGHAPIILPAVTGRALPYSPLFYGPLVLLHLSLALRIAGDLFLWGPGRRLGGLLNGVALLLFLIVNAASAIRGNAGRRQDDKGRSVQAPDRPAA